MIPLKGKLLLVGCGKMGGALLRGWLKAGLKPAQIAVFDPRPADWVCRLEAQGLSLNEMPNSLEVVVVATKPQVMSQALPNLKSLGNGAALIVSIAAGTSIKTFKEMLGEETPIVRTMPNTPAAVGSGVTALIASAQVSADQRALSEALMRAVGETVFLSDEEQMHAVTALSGSGPAYVFAFTEALIRAGCDLGLSRELAEYLAIATIRGSGELMFQSDENPEMLREQVTSPAGTTQAGLKVLLANSQLIDLMAATLIAASNRSKELS